MGGGLARRCWPSEDAVHVRLIPPCIRCHDIPLTCSRLDSAADGRDAARHHVLAPACRPRLWAPGSTPGLGEPALAAAPVVERGEIGGRLAVGRSLPGRRERAENAEGEDMAKDTRQRHDTTELPETRSDKEAKRGGKLPCSPVRQHHRHDHRHRGGPGSGRLLCGSEDRKPQPIRLAHHDHHHRGPRETHQDRAGARGDALLCGRCENHAKRRDNSLLPRLQQDGAHGQRHGRRHRRSQQASQEGRHHRPVHGHGDGADARPRRRPRRT